MAELPQGDVPSRPKCPPSNTCFLSRIFSLVHNRLPARRPSHSLNRMDHRLPPVRRQTTIPIRTRHDHDDGEYDGGGDGDPVVLHEQAWLRPFRPDPMFKRLKLRHGDSVELPMLIKSDSSEETPTVTKNTHPRAVLSFDGQDAGRVNVSFSGSASNHGAAVSRSNHKPTKPGKPAPFFTHAKYNIKMYCGPGYEKFPIAFRRDNKEHEKVSNDWSIKEERKKRARVEALARARPFTSDQYLNDELDAGSSEDEVKDANLRTSTAADLDEETVLCQALEIFPDIEHAFVRTKIRSAYERYRNEWGMDHGFGLETSGIIEEILGGPHYPRQKKESESASHPFEAETGKTIQWNRDNRKDAEYLKDAVIVLANEFDHVPTHFISETVAQKKTIFDSYLLIQDADENFFSRPTKLYKRLKHPREEIEKKYQYTRRSNAYRKPTQYADLIDELMAAKQQAERDRLRKKNEAKDAEDEATNLEIQKLQGLIIECQCCFDGEIPINRAVHCQGENFHWICFECVRGLADSQIGSMRYEMLCVEPGKCQEKLSLDGLAQALSVRTLDRLAFNQQQAEVVAAQIEGLEQCPHCDFRAIVDPIEVVTVFSCQNPDCFKVTCRKCKEPSHLPKTCEEVKKDRGLSARHIVEEARSSAMMRECPRCKTKVIKEAGCNKMSCSCGCLFCYVCNTDLSSLHDGYEHFNARDAKCPLYEGVGGVAQHDQDANNAEEEAIKRARADYKDVAEEELRIETGKSKRAEKGRAKNANGTLNPLRQRLQLRGRLRNEAWRMEGHFGDQQQPRAFEARPLAHIQRIPPHLPPQAPFLPQLQHPLQPPRVPQPLVVGPPNPRPCAHLWPADQDIGEGFEQARRIQAFHRDTARRRNSFHHRRNEANINQPAQQGQNEPHPKPTRRQTEPEFGMQFNPLNLMTGKRNPARDERDREKKPTQHQRRDAGLGPAAHNPQNNIIMDDTRGDPLAYPRDIVPWLEPWNAARMEGPANINFRPQGIQGKENANNTNRDEGYPEMGFLQDHVLGDLDMNSQQGWNALDNHVLEGLALEPFHERDRTRREKQNTLGNGKGKARQENRPPASVNHWLGTLAGLDEDVDMEDLTWMNELDITSNLGNAEAGPSQGRQAPAMTATNGVAGFNHEWWAPGRLDQHPLNTNRRATMPPLTHNRLGAALDNFREDAGGERSGWAANWAV